MAGGRALGYDGLAYGNDVWRAKVSYDGSGVAVPPLISVLMSVYNGQAYLPGALDSVLGQSLADLELIVIDDGSGDATWELLEARASQDSRIRAVRNPGNLGLTRSLNRGLALAQGRYLARQDVDDLSEPARLERQLAFLEAHPPVVLLGSDIRVVDQAGQPSGEIGHRPRGDAGIRRYMLLNNAFFHSTVMLRPAVLAAHGLGYDQGLAYAQDYDLWSRLLEHGQGANLPEPLVRFRRHGGQLSATAWQAQQAVADQVAWANLERQGLAGSFTPQEVGLLRRTALGPGALTGGQRLAQLKALRRLESLLGPAGQDPDQAALTAELWAQLGRQVWHWPRSWAELRAQAAILAARPGAALAHLAPRRRQALPA